MKDEGVFKILSFLFYISLTARAGVRAALIIACRRRFHFVRELGEYGERLLEVEAAEADAEVVRVEAEGALSYYKELLLGHRALAHLRNVFSAIARSHISVTS